MEDQTTPQILAEAQNLFEYSQALRRDLHRNPELGFKEKRTSEIIARELQQHGYEVIKGVAETGVIGLLEGSQPGPTILARFDMDALPIQEETGLEFSSRNPGIMHACGHDGHVAIGLTVARLLRKFQNDLCGTVKLVFQPAEEGLGGAERMIAEGVLDNPIPDYALALHLWNQMSTGWVAIHGGPLMAGSAVFEVVIRGKGGHGALPEETIDPVVAAAHVVTALQSIVSRNISPLHSAIISVTQINAGEAFNVIPSKAVLRGTIRTYEGEVQARLLKRFTHLIKNTCNAFECEAQIDIKEVTPAVINDEWVASQVASAANQFPDLKNSDSYKTTVSEDMAFILEKVPGCYFMVGSAKSGQTNFGHHHPQFDIDERALVIGASIMTAAIKKLSQQTESR